MGGLVLKECEGVFYAFAHSLCICCLLVTKSGIIVDITFHSVRGTLELLLWAGDSYYRQPK